MLHLQEKLAEHIRMKNVTENMEMAWEHSPEAFGQVIMLYVNMEVRIKCCKVSMQQPRVLLLYTPAAVYLQ